MRIEKKMLEGRQHLVVPVVMIRVGTWDGSGGPIYYPADVLENSAQHWNGKPAVVYHPEMFGDGYAGHPEIFNRQKVGTVFNAHFDGDKLRAECWLDVERLQIVDSRVLVALQKRRAVGVSTGLVGFDSGEKRDGATVLERILPDHLAILPDQRGACSLADGAGLLKNVRGYVDESPLELPCTI